jgi:hypothetical protein
MGWTSAVDITVSTERDVARLGLRTRMPRTGSKSDLRGHILRVLSRPWALHKDHQENSGLRSRGWGHPSSLSVTESGLLFEWIEWLA